MEFKPGDYAIVSSSLPCGMTVDYTRKDIEVGEVVQIKYSDTKNVELVGKRPIFWMATRFQKIPHPPPLSLLEKVIWGIE